MWVTEEGLPVQDLLAEMLKPDDVSVTIQKYDQGIYTAAPGLSWGAHEYLQSEPDMSGPADMESARDVMLQTAAEEIAAWLDEQPVDEVRFRISAGPGKRTAKDMRGRGTVKLKRILDGGSKPGGADLSQVGQAMMLRETRANNAELMGYLERSQIHCERANKAALDTIINMGNQIVPLVGAVTELAKALAQGIADGGGVNGDMDPMLQMMKIQADKDKAMMAEVGKALAPLVVGVSNKFLSSPVDEETEEEEEV